MFAPITMALLLFQAPVEPKLATLEGVVTHAATQTPIRKAKVGLTAIGFEGGGTVETGDDGKFAFKDVKPGRYRLTAEKAGYETTAYGAKKPGEGGGQVLRVDAGAAMTTLAIAMPKQGVIAGKILDADSEPMAKALVLALGKVYNQGKPIWLPQGTVPVMSNDLGEYRVGQLPPGKYIVCTIPINWVQPTPLEKYAQPAVEDASTTTCFPNVPQPGEATLLEVKDSSEIPGIDVRMIRTKTVSVQGRITGVPTGGSGSATILNLNTKTAGPIGNALHPRAMVMSADGKFEFKNVVPGSYILHSLPTGLGNAPYVVKAQVEIGDQPVTDLQVPALVPFELKAKITAEPGPELKLGAVRLILTPPDRITSSLIMGSSNADGDVTLSNVAPGRLKVNVQGLASTHYVSQVRLGEQVVEGDEVEIVNASTPLSLTFSLAKAEVSGVVQNAKGEPVPGMGVALVPNPRRPFRLRVARTDQSGTFKMASVPPGEYLAVSLDAMDGGALEDEEYLKPLLAKMKKIKVQDGGSQSVELTVQPVPER